MVANRSPRRQAGQESVLRQLIRAQGLDRFELFFLTGEGKELPGGLEATSGCVLDATGRVFSFWMDWDAAQQRVALTEWEEDEPEPHWARVAEYQRARRALGFTSR